MKNNDKFCTQCGKQQEKLAKFCTNCGYNFGLKEIRVQATDAGENSSDASIAQSKQL